MPASCGPGLSCRRTEPTSVKGCNEPIAVNHPCFTVNDVCVEGALCESSPGPDGGSACEAVTVQRAVGGACGYLNFCDPLGTLECVAGVCELVGDGSEGSQCLYGNY